MWLRYVVVLMFVGFWWIPTLVDPYSLQNALSGAPVILVQIVNIASFIFLFVYGLLATFGLKWLVSNCCDKQACCCPRKEGSSNHISTLYEGFVSSSMIVITPYYMQYGITAWTYGTSSQYSFTMWITLLVAFTKLFVCDLTLWGCLCNRRQFTSGKTKNSAREKERDSEEEETEPMLPRDDVSLPVTKPKQSITQSKSIPMGKDTFLGIQTDGETDVETTRPVRQNTNTRLIRRAATQSLPPLPLSAASKGVSRSNSLNRSVSISRTLTGSSPNASVVEEEEKEEKPDEEDGVVPAELTQATFQGLRYF
jgi:hypothetical protein